MNLWRTFKHLLVPHWRVTRSFPVAALNDIEHAITASEKLHVGELRFVVEGGLHWDALWHNVMPRARAVELFSQLRVWDTERNCGILIYVQWVDRAVEIIADRGIAARVPQAEWDAVCREIEAAFKQDDYRGGALAAIERASGLLAQHFPTTANDRNELSDKPLVI